jgi:hypothetical protein
VYVTLMLVFVKVVVFGFGWKILTVSFAILCVVSFSCFSGILKKPLQSSLVCLVNSSYELYLLVFNSCKV